MFPATRWVALRQSAPYSFGGCHVQGPCDTNFHALIFKYVIFRLLSQRTILTNPYVSERSKIRRERVNHWVRSCPGCPCSWPMLYCEW